MIYTLCNAQAALLHCNVKVPARLRRTLMQPLQRASLRDLIYLRDWAEKYESGGPLTSEQVHNYGRNILKVLKLVE